MRAGTQACMMPRSSGTPTPTGSSRPSWAASSSAAARSSGTASISASWACSSFDRIVAVTAYDRTCFPAAREGFLRAWLTQPGGIALAKLDGGELRGFGVARRCRDGAKIGPLFADDRDTAEALYASLAAGAPGESIYLDVPEINARGMEMAAELGMEEVFGTARMYVGPQPALQHERIFGVTTFELG